MSLVRLFVCIIFCLTNAEEKTNCLTKVTCSECIENVQCIWCSAPYASTSNSTVPIHCTNRYVEKETWCSPDKIIDPPKIYIIEKNEPLTSQQDGSAFQISPQKVALTLRKGEEFILPFQYKQTENYPVDLYYIMDLSPSMQNHQEKLSKLGSKLADTMRNLTNNFRLGFGSFVGKTNIPFVNTVPSKVMLSGTTTLSAPPYTFKNHMSLTDNADAFSNEVLKPKVSGNLDFPEGGFDAVIQAMVCKNEIGWRDHARHLIVLSTDADFHIDDDGKLVGDVNPYYAECHMENNVYTHNSVYDYPSISQINYVAKQNNINFIFAIVNSTENDMYELLQQQIENSVTCDLTKNTDEVVSLISENYNKIVDSVVITDNSENDVEMKYSSTCSKLKERSCSNIHVGEIVNFTVSIRPLRCQPKQNPPQLIQISIIGIRENLKIELTVACDCPCDQSGHPDFVVQASNCNNQGDLKCGICNCYPGSFGKNCECRSSMFNTDDMNDCRQHEISSEICSGLGYCICGRCECIERPAPQLIYGKYCQCDNYSCQRNNGEVCSGKNNGVCDCGQCKCSAGWTGEACECPNTKSTCVAPGSEGLVCSGKGSCSCGECQCHVIDGYRYSGKYCEECISCSAQIRCEELRNCVECQVHKSGVYNESECSLKCNSYTVGVVDKINEENLGENLKICRTLDNSECTSIFQYMYVENKELVVIAQRTKICPEKLN